MVKNFNDYDSQLEAKSAVALTNEAKLSLYKKSQKSGISTDILEEVYRRGYTIWNESFGQTPEQFAFDRVNSFIAGGFAADLDEDLKKACWKGYEAVGMKKKNGKTVPNCVPVKEEELNKSVKSPEELAKKYNKPVDVIKKAVKQGIKVEKEHTTHTADAERIALAHLGEKPDYYTRLNKAGLEEGKQRMEKHSDNPNKSASRFDGSDELVNNYMSDTPGQVIKRVVKESSAWQRKEGKDPEGGLNQKGVESYRREHPGSKLKTAVTTEPSKLDPDSKAAGRRKSFCARMSGMKDKLTSSETAKDPDSRINKSLRKWNCEETEINETSEKLRLSYTNKAMKATREKEKKPGEHFKREEGIHRAARLSIAAKKKEVKEDVATATSAPTPTASSMGPSKLGRNARVELSRRAPAGGEGLRSLGNGRYSDASPTRLTGKRLASSGSATARSLPTQRASVSQPAPKTASAPTSAPKPSASFGSSSRPTSVRATTGGVEKSGGFKLSSGMSDAGKAKVKPTAPVEIPAAAGKAAGLLGKVAKIASGPAATAAMTVMEPTPAGEKKSEFQRQSDVAKGISYKAQGRSVSDYEKQVLTPKTYDKPKAANPVVSAPTPPKRPDYFSRGQAFGAARKEVGGAGGKFSYGGKDYQTNVKGEKYAPASKLKTTSVKEEIINELSPETLGSYVNKAEKQMTRIKAKDPMNTTYGDTDTFHKRKAGVDLAKSKMDEAAKPRYPLVAIRMASGKIEKHPPGKSGSSGGGDE